MVMVPAALAAMAKTPMGVTFTTIIAIRVSVFDVADKISSKLCLFSTPMSAIPKATLNTAAAGTTVRAIELKGLTGM